MTSTLSINIKPGEGEKPWTPELLCLGVGLFWSVTTRNIVHLLDSQHYYQSWINSSRTRLESSNWVPLGRIEAPISAGGQFAVVEFCLESVQCAHAEEINRPLEAWALCNCTHSDRSKGLSPGAAPFDCPAQQLY
jgi:hypothetical protein